MPAADPILTAEAHRPPIRYRLSRRGIGAAACAGGLLLGLTCGAAAMLLPTSELELQVALLQQENTQLSRGANARAHLTVQLNQATQRADQLSQEARRLADATGLALQEAQQMPALKTPAYKEPFERIVAALRAAHEPGGVGQAQSRAHEAPGPGGLQRRS